MKYLPAITTACVLLFLATPPVFAEGAGIEWDIFNQEVVELYRAGKYDRAVVVAKKALEVAKENTGPDHSDVATSLNNLALLYDTQGHYSQAEPLYKRALAIDAHPPMNIQGSIDQAPCVFLQWRRSLRPYILDIFADLVDTLPSH